MNYLDFKNKKTYMPEIKLCGSKLYIFAERETYSKQIKLVQKMNNKDLGHPTIVYAHVLTTRLNVLPSPLLCNVKAAYLPRLQPLQHLPSNDAKMLS